MSNFEITRTSTEARVDVRWRASQHGQFTAQPGTLDLTKFVDGTHYNIGSRNDNVIPSGVAVQYNDTTGMYEPWDPEPEGEDATAAPIAGYINDNQGIDVLSSDGSALAKAPFARLLHGFLEARFLPIQAQAAAAPAAEQTTQITYI